MDEDNWGLDEDNWGLDEDDWRLDVDGQRVAKEDKGVDRKENEIDNTAARAKTSKNKTEPKVIQAAHQKTIYILSTILTCASFLIT